MIDIEKQLTEKAKFTEREVVSILLHLMQEYGVASIKEEEFARKLYFYSQQEQYQHLFVDVCINRYDTGLDLYESLSTLKNYHLLWFAPCDNDSLYLNIGMENISHYFAGKSHRDIAKLEKIAHELYVRDKIERAYQGNLSIYNINPNTKYALTSGERLGTISWELITDGQIQEEIFQQYREVYSNDPRYGQSHIIALTKGKHRVVSIEDATFAIKQGSVNGIVTSASIYTESGDLQALNTLAKIAIEEPVSKYAQLTEESPFVYQLKLEKK